MKDVAIMMQITNRNPHMVRCCGVMLHHMPPLLVTEYYQYGSLFAMLSKAREQVETHSARVSRRVRLEGQGFGNPQW